MFFTSGHCIFVLPVFPKMTLYVFTTEHLKCSPAASVVITSLRCRSGSTAPAAPRPCTWCPATQGRRTCWCPGRGPPPCRPWRGRPRCLARGPSLGGREDRSTGWCLRVWTPGRSTPCLGPSRRRATRRTRSGTGSRCHRRRSTGGGGGRGRRRRRGT